MLAQQYTPETRPASILPALDVSSVAWFLSPDGSTHTGQIESLELIDGVWWAACRYEQLPGVWILENCHAHNFFAGVGPEFRLQYGQPVWFQHGNSLQAATVEDVYLECGEWFVMLEWHEWYGQPHDEKPLYEVRTIQPALEEDPDYATFLSKADCWADYEYEDWRDSR